MNTYRFRFSIGSVPRVKDVEAANPVSGLNAIHRFIQLEEGVKHDGYHLDTMHHYYNGSANKVEMVESQIDLPASKNPDFLFSADVAIESQSELGIKL